MNPNTVQTVADSYQLAMPVYPEGTGFGDLSSTGIGNSIEYQDHREFQPGDDIRRIDWNAYARTGRYIIKQYREEVYPRIEIIVDGSRSVSMPEEKSQLVSGIAAALLKMAHRQKTEARCVYAGEELSEFRNNWIKHLNNQSFSGTNYLPEQTPKILSRLRAGSIRYIISDFLFPHDPLKFLSRISRNSSRTNVIQILSEQEVNPELQGGHRLVDVETGGEMDCYVTEQEIARYKKSLRNLNANLERTALQLNARFARSTTRITLDDCFRQSLLPGGIVTSVPAA